jgi:sec-independent protein translocase protein TatB
VYGVFLFIFESIGTQELILIGIVALIFLGPRRMPEMARKLGKIMSEFRNTTQEFKATWEREASFDEEAKALRNAFNDEPKSQPVARENTILPPADGEVSSAVKPEIREVDASQFDAAALSAVGGESAHVATDNPTDNSDLEAKQNWL